MNRLPSSVLDWKSLYQQLFGKEVIYNEIRIFGCLCFCTTIGPDHDKFRPKASKCVFVGFSPGQKGFKLYDLEEKKIVVSRNVVFREREFSFKCMKEKYTQTEMGAHCPLCHSLKI